MNGMEGIRNWRFVFMLLAVFSLASCDKEPEYADPEAHERTVQLNEQYGPLMVGTWHFEEISDTQQFFEQLSFKDDGTFTGMRIWKWRKLVTIDGQQCYTDWEDMELSGTFTGTWGLRYWSPDGEEKRDCLQLMAKYDGEERNYMAYSYVADFDHADENTLRFQGYYAKDEDGWINYQRGEATPSF